MGLRLGSRPTSFFIPRHAYAYNRRTFVESLTATRNGSPLFRQRLEYDRSGQITAQQYEHGDGAQTGQMQTYNTAMESRILRNEEYGYSFRGLMNRASVQTVVDGVIEPLQEWRYRYNAMGEREQKRLYASAGGVVPSPESARYPWVYYLLGGTRQLAVYHGQHLDSLQTECGDLGLNRVYLYPHEYITYGAGSSGLLITRPTGRKEYKLVDHLGSTRAVLDESGNVIGRYDNEPFGAPLAVAGVETRKQYIDKETDRETETGNFGVRQYDPAKGSFGSVDPLWEKFPSQLPYHYSYNNPLGIKDPSGMSGVPMTMATVPTDGGPDPEPAKRETKRPAPPIVGTKGVSRPPSAPLGPIVSTLGSAGASVGGFAKGVAAEVGTVAGSIASEAENVAGNIASKAEGLAQAGKDQVVTLYRAVMDNELAGIVKKGVLENIPGIENKYFSATIEGAARYAKLAYGKGGDISPHTIVQVTVAPILTLDLTFVDGGIPAVAIPTSLLDQLGPPTVLPSMPIPQKP